MFLFQTGNVLSNNSIFNVDNIEINTNANTDYQKSIDIAFKNGFKKLIARILLKKDQIKIENTQINEIKNLILYYQFIKDKKKDQNDKVNIFFNREKINSFFYKKNILYADLSKIDLAIFPILIEKEKTFIYSENYLYNNWNKSEILDDKNKFIDYILPIESLEIVKFIQENIENLELIDTSKIFKGYDLENFIFLIIDASSNEVKIFFKGIISEKKIVKNLTLISNLPDKEENLDSIIMLTKNQITEIVKAQNLIDIRTPSFLNINLDIKKTEDLLILKNHLGKIDLINKFDVQEINKKYAKVKIKYYGNLNKIIAKLKSQGIKVNVLNNQWFLEII